MSRIAIIDKDKCKPKRCNLECKKMCPIVMNGKDECIVINEKGAKIDETLCSGCGICAKVCPFKAIRIINLPEVLNKQPIHQYGENGFRVFNLPMVQEGKVTGIIGKNGIGKSTVINILSGFLKANFGENFDEELNDDEYYKKLNDFFKGSVLQSYFLKLKNKDIKVSYKPQQILALKEHYNGSVKGLLLKLSDEKTVKEFSKMFEMENFIERDIDNLSGGELQRVAVVACLLKKETNFFVFDEISNYLDIYQRLNVSKLILEKIKNKTSLIVEHDLIILDYLIDYVHIQFGVPGGYGILTGVKSSKLGINEYLYGYAKEENVRFRDKPITFEKDSFIESKNNVVSLSWDMFSVEKGAFKLEVEKGELMKGEILGVVGRNGIGKTTMISYIAENSFKDRDVLISYKPQLIPVSENLVKDDLMAFETFFDNFYKVSVLEPLNIDDILEKKISTLSGGELQRYAITKTLLKEADIYLFDEPTAFLDVEDRLTVSKILRNFMKVKGKSAIIIDHDLIFIDYLSDRLLVFQGIPAVNGVAKSPSSMKDGMNYFLRGLGITFRRDENNKRPRVNKLDSVKDKKQKMRGEFYYV